MILRLRNFESTFICTFKSNVRWYHIFLNHDNLSIYLHHYQAIRFVMLWNTLIMFIWGYIVGRKLYGHLILSDIWNANTLNGMIKPWIVSYFMHMFLIQIVNCDPILRQYVATRTFIIEWSGLEWNPIYLLLYQAC